MRIPDNIYTMFVRSMPIACVDLLVTNGTGRVLLLKRKNPPADGQWWFPGGRVHFHELRMDAAKRKLKEECGLETDHCLELGTFDLMLAGEKNDHLHHAITTVYQFEVASDLIILDEQSTAYSWRTVNDWLSEALHPFLRQILGCHQNKR